jgi:hypothetical protein
MREALGFMPASPVSNIVSENYLRESSLIAEIFGCGVYRNNQRRLTIWNNPERRREGLALCHFL